MPNQPVIARLPQAYRFALDLTPAQERALMSHAGAARVAYNHMLGLVKANMDQRAAERTYGIADEDLTPSMNWSLYSLRKEWNQRKDEVAPWWGEVSKEAFNTGLAALASALDNWSKSKKGKRKGPAMGFPRFKARSRSIPAVTFTTGAIRIEADRHHITLPRLGKLKTHESTRKLARKLEAGTARITTATVRREGGRWFVSFVAHVDRPLGPPAHVKHAGGLVGIDVGVKDLLVVARADGTELERIAAPRASRKIQAQLKRAQREAARRQGPWKPDRTAPRGGHRQEPSKRWKRSQDRVAKLHARAANVRRDAIHKATTQLAQTYDAIAVETLNIKGMTANGGAHKKGLNRAIADASLAEIRRQLTYKASWYGSAVIPIDRWFPSTKTCSSCGTLKAKMSLAERTYLCTSCGVVIDRDLNAAINLARRAANPTWGEPRPAVSGTVAGHGAVRKTRAGSPAQAAGVEVSIPKTRKRRNTGTVAPKGATTQLKEMSTS